jgi:CubicO group peptidase (beta-lactamase class C family)
MNGLKLMKLSNVLIYLTLLLYLVALIAPATATAQGDPAPAGKEKLAAIDAYIETQMKELRIPGLALGIVQGDQIIHLKGFGIADPSGRAVTPQTPFSLGSLNKPITDLAVMQLVEQGKVELDAPVQRYIPWFRIADEAASAQITVRHLMLQTSGMATNAGYANATDTDTSDTAIERRVRAMRSTALAQPVGTAFAYSNDSFIVLALLIQQVTGQSYNDYLKEHVFAPLQMSHSSASLPEAMTQGMATGYRHWFDRPFPADLPWNRGQIPLYASAEDLSHYLIAHLNEGRFGTASVLSPPGIAELQRPANRDGTDEVFWGMGWEIKQEYGLPMLHKNGDEANFHADLILLPESRSGIVLLTNAPRMLSSFFGNQPESLIAIGVAKLLAGQQPVVIANSKPLLVYVTIPLILILQAMLAVRAVVLLRRWRSQPAQRPQRTVSRVLHVVLPLLFSIVWGCLMLFGASQLVGAPLSFLIYIWPDVGYTLLLSGLFALGWGVVRAVLAYLALRPTSTPPTSLAGAPVIEALKP